MGQIENQAQAVQFLTQLGYRGDPPPVGTAPAPASVSVGELIRACDLYRKHWGLGPTATPVKQVAEHLNLRTCACPDILEWRNGEPLFATEAAGDCRWPDGDISYYSDIRVPQFSVEETSAMMDRVFEKWARVCGIRPRKAGPGANIVAKGGFINGPGGVLAYAYLPCGASKQSSLGQVYDSGEGWRSIGDLERTADHETGHSLGLHHSTSRSDIMYPYLTQYTEPQAGDIRRVVALYGRPVDRPTPEPDPDDPAPPVPGPGGISFDIVIGGRPFTITIRAK